MTDAITEPDLSHILEPLRQFAVPVDSLNHDPKNAQLHSDRNITAIKDSFLECGQDQLLVVQKQGMIVRKGNGRLMAAKALGWTHIAVIVVEEDDVAGVTRAIADNRASALAETDDNILAELLKFTVDHGKAAIGWTTAETADMFLELEKMAAEAAALAGEGDDYMTAPPEFTEGDSPAERGTATHLTLPLTLPADRHRECRTYLSKIKKDHDLQTMGDALDLVITEHKRSNA